MFKFYSKLSKTNALVFTKNDLDLLCLQPERYWIGRVRGEVSIKYGESAWQWNKAFYPQATDKPLFLGESQLAKRSPLKCFAYLYKSHPKGRKAHRHSRTCQKYSAGKVFHKGAQEPWLLVTTSPKMYLTALKLPVCTPKECKLKSRSEI